MVVQELTGGYILCFECGQPETRKLWDGRCWKCAGKERRHQELMNVLREIARANTGS